MATGDIGSVLDTLEFDTTQGLHPHMVRVSGDVYAVAYSGPLGDGWVCTFTVDSDGVIGDSVIDTLEFDAVDCLTPKIRNISGDTFAIIYDFTGNFTKIVTVDIDSSGNIGGAIIDFLTIASTGTPYPSRLVSVSGDIYAAAHKTPVNRGEVFTVDIDSSGNIGGAVIDTLEYNATQGITPDLINISGTMFAVAYSGPNSDGWLATFNIASNGAIDNSVTATSEFDAASCTYPRILNVSGDVYAIAYKGVGNGFVKTLTINGAGAISAVTDTLELTSSAATYTDMVNVGGTVFAVSYLRLLADTGFIETFTISPSGTFSAAIDILEFEPTDIEAYPSIALITGSAIVCMVYGGPDLDGFAKTALIELAPPTVTTQAVTSILETTATGNGNVTDLGSGSVSQHGHCWATSTNPTTSDSKTENGAKGSTGAFTSSITGLSTGVDYFVRAYATNLGGTSYGDNVTFQSDHVPTIITDTCSNVEGTTAKGRGNITDLGGDNASAHGHCWNTSINPTTSNDNVDNGGASVTGAFISAITGLTPGTVYYVRAFATNTVGIAYGNNVRFKASLDRAGIIWMEGSNFRGFDENAIEGKYIRTADVDDSSVNGETEFPISSNWAYDHENDDDVHDATAINVSELSSATYDDVQDYVNFFGDRTLLSGGGITDNGDGTAAVASLTGWCKITDDDDAIAKFFDWASPGNTPSLTDMTTNYLYLDYNGGSLQLVVSTDILTHGYKLDHLRIATIYRHNTVLHWHLHHFLGIQRANRADMHHLEEHAFHRARGMVTSDETNRNLSVTAGVLFEGNDREVTLAFDTSRSGQADLDEVNKLHDQDADFTTGDVGKAVHNTTDNTYGVISAFVNSGELTLASDTFPDGNELFNIDWWSYWYYNFDGSAWVEVPGATQINNTQYNLTTSGTGLATLSAAVKYGVHWVYMEADGQHFHVVYGQGNYFANEAEEAGVPSLLPNIVTNYCVLIAKIELQKNTDSLIISYPWTAALSSTLATDHGSLGGLTDDDHTQYLLADGSRALAGAWDMGSQLITNLKLGGTMDANSQALINVLDLDLGTESAMGTFSAMLTAANAGTAWVIRSKDSIDIQRARLGLSGGVDTAVWGWVNSTHTGIVTSDIDINGGTLDGVTITSPNINEAVALTATATELNKLDGGLQALTWQGTQTLNGQVFDAGSGSLRVNTTGDNEGIDVYSTNEASGVRCSFYHVTASPVANDIPFQWYVYGKDTGGTQRELATQRFLVESVGATTLAGKMDILLRTGAAWNTALTLSSAGALWIDAGLEVGGDIVMAGNAVTGHAQAITDNAIVTVDGSPADDEFARWTPAGIEGLNVADTLTALGVAAGADVTGNNAPQAHEGTHVSGGSDDIDSALAPIAIALTTRGDTVYQDASGLQRLAKGSSGDVLTMGANDPAWAAPSGGATKEFFVPVQSVTAATGDFPIVFSTGRASLKVPHDFGSIVSVEAICMNGNTEQLDVLGRSDYGAIGESFDANSEEDTTLTTSFTADKLTAIDISGILSSLAADDYVGIFMFETGVIWIGIRFRYS